ncbi:MAG: Wzz/FepE/Etk N-terminal domain-containing protein [Candidatus Cloacimonetes bacterium]|nr:Wzz/FepE/Etk N-terminal domain-containing protein [Candidatus Cloacimonadota bacterium]
MTKDMGILDLTLILAKHRKLIIIITILAAVGSIIYAMLAPFYWISKAAIIPVSETNSIGGFSTNLLDIVGGGMIKTQKVELATDFITVMKSRTFREKVIEEFDLISYFKINKPFEQAREQVLHKMQNSMIRLVFDQESSIVSISAETKDKSMSVNVVNYYLNELEKYNQNSRMSTGRLKREFMEGQVEKNMAEVDSLAMALRDFQSKNKSVALDQQTEAMVGLYAETVAQYMQTELELDLAKTQYSDTSPLVLELGAKKELLGQKVKELEDSSQVLAPSYLIQIDKVPDLSMKLALLMMNLKIKQTVIEYLYPQYELAKLEEMKDMPSFEVIDAPREAGRRSKPKRAVLVILITMAAFISSCVIALICESLNQNKELVQSIVATIKGKH